MILRTKRVRRLTARVGFVVFIGLMAYFGPSLRDHVKLSGLAAAAVMLALLVPIFTVAIGIELWVQRGEG